MAKTVSSQHYNSIAKSLHWLIALAIIFMLALGWIMGEVPKTDPLRFTLFQLHKSVGITILLLSIMRLAWRLMNPPPPYPSTMPQWEKTAAHITHFLFYVLMIGMPLTGWIIVSSSSLNVPTILYGIIPWPSLPVFPDLPNKKDIGHTFGELHELLAYGFAGLIVLHVGAAWKHHLFERDDILTRMAPRFLTGLLNKIRGQG